MSESDREKIAQKVCNSLQRNGIKAVYARDRKEALQHAISLIQPGDAVGVGGSVTLAEVGLVKALRGGSIPRGKFTFYDQYQDGLPREEALALRHKSLDADIFFSGANAITESGEIVNMDGFGNRVAALAFGPRRVVIVAGVNKIVNNVPEAMKRIKTKAAPLNCRRLKRLTPCYKTGRCDDIACAPPMRICNVYSVIVRQPSGNSITVILVGEDLGY